VSGDGCSFNCILDSGETPSPSPLSEPCDGVLVGSACASMVVIAGVASGGGLLVVIVGGAAVVVLFKKNVSDSDGGRRARLVLLEEKQRAQSEIELTSSEFGWMNARPPEMGEDDLRSMASGQSIATLQSAASAASVESIITTYTSWDEQQQTSSVDGVSTSSDGNSLERMVSDAAKNYDASARRAAGKWEVIVEMDVEVTLVLLHTVRRWWGVWL